MYQFSRSLYRELAPSVLFGLAEVLRDNAAQTLMPSVVSKDNLGTMPGLVAGTLLTFRRPTVLAGIGVSKASIMGGRKFRRTVV